jgi:hypothetical protein
VGAFFANVQVHTAGRPSADVYATVRESLRRWVLEGTLEEVDPATPNDDVDRLILLGPPGDEPWIAVFDEASDNQDTSQLDALAAMLSEATQSAVVGVLVHDDSICA